MKSVYDWLSLLIFAALVTRFLQQSAKPAGEHDSLWHYLIASAGCAGANWLGNNGWHLAAITAIAGTIAYALYFLGPRSQPRS